MATRAAIVYLDPKNYEAISTYNHYDGYPENLGIALETHYNDDFKANRIANEGYISYVDPETGEIDAKNQDDPTRIELSDDEGRSAYAINDDIQAMGADYAYIWSPALGKWTEIKNYGANATADRLEQMMPELFGMGNMEDEDVMEEKDYMTEWKNFLNEENMDNKVVGDTSMVVRDAEMALKGEHDPHVEMYIDSLTNDIRLNGDEAYEDYNEEDWKEDFNQYIIDKMDA